MADDKRVGTIGIGSYGDGRCDLKGLEPKEVELVQGSILGGHHWIRRGQDGRLEHVPSYEQLPSPTQDEEMHPFWRRPEEGERNVQMELSSHLAPYNGSSPSISIQHLCGHNYTPEDYKTNADRLEEYGFECLRSRRSLDGKFWEIWFLPSVWMAKGELKEHLEASKAKSEISKAEKAIEFLRQAVTFGTLDASIQRLAMIID